MSIVGNDDAPKALVIVPWKSSALGQRARRLARARRRAPAGRQGRLRARARLLRDPRGAVAVPASSRCALATKVDDMGGSGDGLHLLDRGLLRRRRRVHVPDPARGRRRRGDRARALRHADAARQPRIASAWSQLAARARERRLRQGARADRRTTTRPSRRLLAHGPRPAGRRAAPRGRRDRDGREHDGDRPAAREAHALPRHVREPRDAARPARHRQRSDPRLRARWRR